MLRASQENTACPLCRNVLIPPKNEEDANNLADAAAHQRAYIRGYERGRVDLEEEHAEEHEEEGGEEHHEMAIHVIGVGAGSTSFKLQLMHEGHADYTSTNNVTVTVN